MPKPQRSLANVDQIPDSAPTGHFVLPLLHLDTAMGCSGQPTFELMVPAGRRGMIGSRTKFAPRYGCIRGSLLTQRLPALDGLIGGEPQLPLPAVCRWRNTVATLGAHLGSNRRGRNLSEIFVARH